MSIDFEVLLHRSRKEIFSLLQGQHLSKVYGEGYDLAQLREYQYGDDIRKISWLTTAKMQRPFIKQMQAEQSAHIAVALLMDGALYCAHDNTKQHLMVEVGAMLGYAAQQGGDTFQGIGHTPKETFTTSPTKHPYAIEQFFRTLYHTELLHTSLALAPTLDHLYHTLQHPSLLFVLHDFLLPVDLSLLAQKHEVVAVMIRHQEEELLSSHGEITLHDPTDGTHRHTYLNPYRTQHYTVNRQAHDAAIVAHFLKHRIRYVKIATNENPAKKLHTLFG